MNADPWTCSWDVAGRPAGAPSLDCRSGADKGDTARLETASRQFARKGSRKMEEALEGELRIGFYLFIHLARGSHNVFVCRQGKQWWCRR